VHFILRKRVFTVASIFKSTSICEEIIKMLGIVSLVIGLLSLLFGIFWGKKKGDEADFKNLTRIGWLTTVIVPIITAVISINSALHDLDEIAAKNNKIKEDSILLANRWLHDTIRLHQIIDSSKLIIDSTNSILRTAKSVLKSLSDVDSNVRSDLKNSDAERYPLFPLEIRVEYLLKFKKAGFYEAFPNYRISELSKNWHALPDTSKLFPQFSFNSSDSISQSRIGILTPYFIFSKQRFRPTDPSNLGLNGNFSFSPGHGPGLDSKFLYIRYSVDSVVVEATKIFRNVQFHYEFYTNDIKGVKDLLGYRLNVCIPHQGCIPTITKVVLSIGVADRTPRFILKSFKMTRDVGMVAFYETIVTTKNLANMNGYKVRAL